MLVQGFICEGPRCKKGPNGQRVYLHWEATSNPPDDAHRMIFSRAAYEEPGPKQSPTGQPLEHTFCGAGCLRDFYIESNYTPPRSPKELEIIREINANAERERNEELRKRTVGTVTVTDTTPALTTTNLPQADGDTTDLERGFEAA